MKVAAVLAHKGDFVATIAPDATVSQLLVSLAENNIGAVVVSDQAGRMIGVASERDIVRAVNTGGARILDAPVSQIMSSMVATCTTNTPIEEIMVLMTEQRVRHVPVVDDAQLIGIVSIGDIVKAKHGRLAMENRFMKDYIRGD